MRFRIEYNDPSTGERCSVDRTFEDGDGLSAKEWAEDYAYSRADKGWYRVTEWRTEP